MSYFYSNEEKCSEWSICKNKRRQSRRDSESYAQVGLDVTQADKALRSNAMNAQMAVLIASDFNWTVSKMAK